MMTGRPSSDAVSFIYGLVDPRDDAIRYVGKANDVISRFRGHLRDAARRDTPVYRWVRKLKRLGLEPRPCSLVMVRGDWRDDERRIIAEFRESGERLLNVADGGDEPFCPSSVRAENGRRVARSRPKNVMRAYRLLESNIRFVEKRNNPELLAKLRMSYEQFREAVSRHRVNGTIDALDANLGEYFVMKRTF